MKAIVQTKYGSPDVLQLQEVDKPIPQDNEVLIKIFATPFKSWPTPASCDLSLTDAIHCSKRPKRTAMSTKGTKKAALSSQ